MSKPPHIVYKHESSPDGVEWYTEVTRYSDGVISLAPLTPEARFLRYVTYTRIKGGYKRRIDNILTIDWEADAHRKG